MKSSTAVAIVAAKKWRYGKEIRLNPQAKPHFSGLPEQASQLKSETDQY